MSIFSFLGKDSVDDAAELPEIYPLALKEADFGYSDIVATYVKILTDTLERTHGLSDKQKPLLWDNCVQTEAAYGLVTLLAEAMADKAELFLVYKPSLNVLREATYEEKEEIRKDYEKQGQSSKGVFISFKNYSKTDMLNVYASLEYAILCSLYKTVNIAKAIQIKIHELRASVSLKDSSVARAQAKEIANALSRGKDIFLDSQDEVTTATPDTAPTEKAVAFLDNKRAYLLGLPISYITGLQTAGMNSTGGADSKAVERGLKQYFVSIIQPALLAIFKAQTEFKSQDFEGLTSALDAARTFDLVSNDYLSTEAKKEILARLFDLDPEEEEKNLEADAEEAEASGEEETDPNATPSPDDGETEEDEE